MEGLNHEETGAAWLVSSKSWSSFINILSIVRYIQSVPLATELFRRFLQADPRRALGPRYVHYFRMAPTWLFPVLLQHPEAQNHVSAALDYIGSWSYDECELTQEDLDVVWLLCEKGAVVPPVTAISHRWKLAIVEACCATRTAACALYGVLRKRRGLDRNVASGIARRVWDLRRAWREEKNPKVKK
jgi:hypothetical protein